MKKLPILVILFSPLLIAVLALAGLFVGVALKFDTATALIVVCPILLIDVAVESRNKRGSE